jgi:hypothetical protein
MNAKTDKDFLDLLGMSENEAANILGKSRQSLYQAGLAKRDDYFRRADIKDLVFTARGRNPQLDLPAVVAYVAASRDANLADEIQRLSNQEAKEATLLNYDELWIVIPDLGWMEASYSDNLKKLLELGKKKSQYKVSYLTSCVADRMELEQALKQQGIQQNVVSATWIGAIPPLIIGNPTTFGTKTYVFASGSFAPNDWYGGSRLVALIRSMVNDNLKVASKLAASEGDNADRMRGRFAESGARIDDSPI